MYLRNFKKDETHFTANYVVPAYAKYISGDRKEFITIDTNLTNASFTDSNKSMSDWSFLFDGVSKLNSDENYNEMDPGDNSQIVFDFEDEQLLTKVIFETRKNKNIKIQMKYSDDKEIWTVAGEADNFEYTNYTDITISLNMLKPSKHFLLKIISQSDNEKGNINNLRFINTKSGILTKDINTKIDNSLLPAGQINFDYKSISTIDSSGNKIVRFNITNNTIDGASSEYSPLSMTAQRLSSDNKSIIDGIVDINGYLSISNTAFFNESIVVKSYIQSGDSTFNTAGVIKLYDKNASSNGDWVDITIDNKKLYFDGVDFIETVSKVILDDTISSTSNTYSSNKILELIDDFDKIDTYIGAYYYTKDSLFDKYIDIDKLFGKIYEGSATADEIASIETLNNQLGLLVTIDNNIAN